MDSLKIVLAGLFDFFKLKSPVIAATVLSILGLIAYNFNAIAADFGITDQTFLAIAKWVNIILLAITAPHTTAILQEAKAEEAPPTT